MLVVTIPGKTKIIFKHLVLDYNGTIAFNGLLIPGVEEKLNLLAGHLKVHIVTADTFGHCTACCRGIKGSVHILTSEYGAAEKENFIEDLGAEHVIAIGNGTNDAKMLSLAALGIVIVGPEGTSVKALQAADVVAGDIHVGLDLLLNPNRLIATLRE